MPAKGTLHTVAAVQIQTVEFALVNMAATWELESRKQTP